MASTMRHFVACFALVVFALAGAQGLQVVFIYPTPINDFAYAYSHEIARVEVEKYYIAQGVLFNSTFVSNVTTAEVSAMMDDLVRNNDVIVGTGSQFSVPISVAAEKYPKKYFVSINSNKVGSNVAIGFPKIYQGAYLLGYACAMITKTGVVGFVSASDRLPSHTRGFNAFFAGAKTFNSSVTVRLAVVNSFLDPVTERKATERLIDEGNVGCVASQVNDNTVNIAAANKGVFSVGYASDARLNAGEKVLTSMLFNWFPYYTKFFDQVLNGTWTGNQSAYLGINDGAVELAYWSTQTPGHIRSAVNDQFSSMAQNSTSFNPFCGEFATDWNADGSCLTQSQLLGMTTIISGLDLSVNVTRDDVMTRVFIAWEHPAAIVMAALLAVFMVAGLISMADLFWYRHTMVYRASSPVFCALIMVSIMLAYISLFFWVGEPTTTTCALRVWFGGVGFCLLYANILAKNWRISKIFGDESMRVFAITNFDLIVKWIMPVVGIELALLVLWQSLDPLVPIQSPSPLADDEILTSCSSQQPTFLILNLVYYVLLLLPASIISYSTRRIIDEFKESETIALSVYTSFLIGLVVVGVDLIVTDSVVNFFVVTVFGILIIFAVSHFLIFIPKFYRIHVLNDKREFSLTTSRSKSRSKESKAKSATENSIDLNLA